MLRRMLVTIAYDGSEFFGWQRQDGRGFRTVQAEFEKAVSLFFKKEITCIGASRTDRGVHAFGQRAVIDVDTTVPVDKFPLAIIPFLPKDISVTDAVYVNDNFNPRFDCVCKTYRYRIYNGKYRNPVYRKYSEFCCKNLDVEEMSKAAKAFLGRHDFKAFAASGNTSKTTVRTIFDINVRQEDDFIIIDVTGDGFLYNMIRIMAGTLLMVGDGRIKSWEIPEIIESRQREKAGKTAGPEGLTLMNIKYNI